MPIDYFNKKNTKNNIMNYTAQQLASITHSKLLGKADLIVKNIVFDSRTIFAVNQTALLLYLPRKIQVKNIYKTLLIRELKLSSRKIYQKIYKRI